ncbi:hypothetical protein KJI95_12580 [Shewanella sp. JM162201]|uniref:Glycosyl transferases group 1 n=1 Tax=Shewanella jiangmenensis TaxID=2837387 RepID=A0ABS5V4H0_9GAMM|nr:hypothetical protein [Shewanella jiangmenensis]MBT1445357.1 hypothetical protein [Shewanella jiangmenensis]
MVTLLADGHSSHKHDCRAIECLVREGGIFDCSLIPSLDSIPPPQRPDGISMKILFVNFSKRGLNYYADASVRYRCIYPSEYFNSLGIKTHAINISQVSKINLSTYTHVICHRPQHGRGLINLLRLADQLNFNIYADIDDYLFSPNMEKESPAILSGKLSVEVIKNSADNYFKALKLFPHIICSTQPLADKVRQSMPEKQVSVCFNKLPKRHIFNSPNISDSIRFNKKIIRYLPGTSHHQHDFDLIKPWLEDILIKYPQIKFELIGDISLGTLAQHTEQVSFKKSVQFENLTALIADSWLTIAPLVNNDFNLCKSGLKGWESGLLGIPVIASQLPDMQRMNCEGVCISDSMAEWTTFLERMLDYSSYQHASDMIYKASTLALFDSISDERLSVLNIYGVHEETLKYSEEEWLLDAQLAARFGYSWPATMLNPCHKQHKELTELKEKTKPWIISFDSQHIDWTKISSESKSEILTQLSAKAESASIVTMSNIEKLFRKTRKLLRSPQQFWLDSKIFNIIKETLQAEKSNK